MSRKARKTRTKRHRREYKQAHKAKANSGRIKPKHRAKTGRTGGIHYKKTPSRKKLSYQVMLTFDIPACIRCLEVHKCST